MKRLLAIPLVGTCVVVTLLGLATSPGHAAVNRPPIFVAGIVPGEIDPSPLFIARARIAISREGSPFMCGTVWHAASGNDVVVQRFDDAPLGWTQTWSGPGTRDDWAQDIAFAHDGSVYVCGMAETGGFYGTSMFLLKYSSDGTLLWERLWDYLNANPGLKLDGTGNIYVYGQRQTGDTGELIVLAKYRPDGSRAWWRQYPAKVTMSPHDVPYDLFIDARGRSYLAGIDDRHGADPHALLVSYTATGKRRWVRIYSGPGSVDSEFFALARCAGGGVYACGCTWDHDMLVTRYTATGRRVLTKRLGRGAVSDAALDRLGRLVLCGSGNKRGHGFRVALLRSDGRTVWSHSLPGSYAEAVVVDSRNRVYAVGRGGATPSTTVYGPLVVNAFSTTGTVRWRSTWPSATAPAAIAHDIACWQSSNVWVSGASDRALTGFDQFLVGWGL